MGGGLWAFPSVGLGRVLQMGPVGGDTGPLQAGQEDRGGQLDVGRAEMWAERFPTILAACRAHGIDPPG
ncbi:hypothetical protein CLM82_10855, partial [Streptomyces albidoflavus]|uniref:hypothetical protein n=1 Tax=Streptomyces albidoflavus TaxID=1886 RepID=UPI000BD5A167